MPALTNPRWEKACQLRSSGKGVGEAYELAGFKPSSVASCNFFKRPNISARIVELQEKMFGDDIKTRTIAIKKVALEESWIIERAKYVVELSLRGNPIMENGQPTGRFDGKTNLRAATDALRLCADFKGMRIQRVELGGPGDFARMTDDELDMALVEQAKGLGLPEEAVTRLIELRAEPTDEAAE
jgi:hypothetical protein